MCCYFGDIINGTKIKFSNILLNKKIIWKCFRLQHFIISYKSSTGSKPFPVRVDKIDGFTISLDCKIRHLLLFDYVLFECYNIY